MCPACVLTIGMGLFVAKKLGVSDVLAIGIVTIVISQIVEIFLRRINRGKAFFSYQKIILPLIILLISIFAAQFLL